LTGHAVKKSQAVIGVWDILYLYRLLEKDLSFLKFLLLHHQARIVGHDHGIFRKKRSSKGSTANSAKARKINASTEYETCDEQLSPYGGICSWQSFQHAEIAGFVLEVKKAVTAAQWSGLKAEYLPMRIILCICTHFFVHLGV